MFSQTSNESFLVDSHCHLLFSRFKMGCGNIDSDFDVKYGIDAIVQRAVDANVRYLLAIGTDLADVSEMQEIVDRHENVFRTVGIHPLEADAHYQRYSFQEISQTIRHNCNQPKTVGIGEIGLDYHYGQENERQQKAIFHQQLDLARECSLPVSIHSRKASKDVIDILGEHYGVCGVIHCFSGEKDFARCALEMGFYISISGVVTYRNAAELRDTLKFIPLDRLLIETDAPFLAPHPFRGKINEPSLLVYTASKISEILELPLNKINKCSSQNFFQLFFKR
ncbi:MAG: TatD family hydrolase [Holosporaceae bacterium]|jgi:TatD DNase family protein|nr:TatD family hydrolase [Holosporaceae bacterium]